MEKQIRISVIIPTCDHRGFLNKALASVLRQTFSPLEIIIIDNGQEQVKLENLNEKIRLFRIEPPSGVSAARNYGAKIAQGDYLAWLDDDDEWQCEYLKKAVAAILNGAECVFSRMDFINQKAKYELYKNPEGKIAIKNLLTYNPGVSGSNMVVSREKFFQAGGYDEKLITSEDKSLVIELIKNNTKILVLPENQVIIMLKPGLRNAVEMERGIYQFTLKYKNLMSWQQYLFNWHKIYYYRRKAGGQSVGLPYVILTMLFSPKSVLDKIKQTAKKIIYKTKSLFRKKIYVNLDGIILNATYTNRYFKNKENEGKKILNFLNSKNIDVKTIVDLGANFGEISLYLAKYLPSAKILAVEPSAMNLKVFKDNLTRQNFPVGHLEIIEEAISDKPGLVKITKVLGGQNTIVNLKGRTEKVKADTLESMVRRANIKQIDFLKIDIEGAEYLLYDSLKKLLPYIKAILIEISSDKRNIPLLELLFKHGEIFIRNEGKWPGTLLELEENLMRESNDLWFINSYNNHKSR